MTPLLSRALRQGAPLLAGQAVVVGAGFLLQAALVGWVFADRPEEMGRLGVLSEALQWITVVALMGMPAAVLRFRPRHPEQAGGILRSASAAVVAAAFALPFVCAVPGPVSRLLAGDVAGDGPFFGYMFRAVPLCAIAVVTAALHADGRLGRKAFVEGAERVAVLVLGLAGAVAGGFSGLLWGMLGGSCVAWGLAWTSFLREPRAGDAAPKASFPFRRLAAVGAPQLALSLLETLRPLVLLRIVQEAGDPVALGHLATAKTFALPLVLLPEILAQALFPAMSGPHGESAHVEGERRRFVGETLLAGLGVCVVFGALAAWLLPQVGTGRYAGAVVPLLAFLPGVLAHGATAHTGYVLLVRDRLGKAALASALALVVTVLLAAVLVPSLGATGGALALSGALVVRAALLVAFARGD